MNGERIRRELSTGIRKEGMETGRTERGRARKPKGREAAPKEPPTGENGKKGKERTESQVVRTGTEADERKQKGKGKARKRKHKGSTGGTAVGAKPGGMKRNEQKAEYEEPGERT